MQNPSGHHVHVKQKEHVLVDHSPLSLVSDPTTRTHKHAWSGGRAAVATDTVLSCVRVCVRPCLHVEEYECVGLASVAMHLHAVTRFVTPCVCVRVCLYLRRHALSIHTQADRQTDRLDEGTA